MRRNLSPGGYEVIVDTGIAKIIRHPVYGAALVGPFRSAVIEDGVALVPDGWENLEDEETHFVGQPPETTDQP